MRMGKQIAVGVLVSFIFFGFGFKKKSSSWDSLYSQAEEKFQEKEYSSALLLYQKIIEDYPFSEKVSQAQFRIAECYYAIGKEQEAREQFLLYIQNNRGNAPELAKAYEYLQALERKDFLSQLQEKENRIQELERKNARLREALNWLHNTVSSEEIYLEINLAKDQLYIKMGTQVLYAFPIVSGKGRVLLKATGEERDFSTPKGIFEVIGKEENPVWYRPDWSWLERGEKPPENLTREERAIEGVLGKYRIHFGGGYSIHGTKSGRIKPGKYSHGCIRMNAKDLEKVWEMTQIGTKIFIY